MKLAGLDSGHSLSVFFETPANAAGFIWSGENGVNTPSEMSLHVSNSIVLEDEKYNLVLKSRWFSRVLRTRV